MCSSAQCIVYAYASCIYGALVLLHKTIMCVCFKRKKIQPNMFVNSNYFSILCGKQSDSIKYMYNEERW